MLATVENSPCNPTGILALEEQTLGLSVGEAEDFGVAADKDLALRCVRSLYNPKPPEYAFFGRDFCEFDEPCWGKSCDR